VDPFGGVIKDGAVYGRGAIDFKGGIAVFARAAMLLADRKVPLDRDVIFLAEADEEGAPMNTTWLSRQHWDKMDAEFALNEGGWIIKRDDGRVQYVSISTSDKRVMGVTITAKGTSTHASMPLPDNALVTIGRALAKLGGPEQVPGMVKGVLTAAAGQERTDAERALVTVCTENPGHEQATESFLTIFKTASDADREVLLSPLGRIGGPGAMAVVDALLADTDPAKREFGLVALTRWPDATVAPKLLDMVAKAPDAATRDRLLGALIRIAPLPDNKLNDKQKHELLEKTMQLCEQDADRGKVIERANAIRTVETFRFVLPYLDEPTLAEPACKSVVELAHHQQLRDAHKDDFTKALDKVIATTKNPELVERANRYKEGKTWARK
jgi:hypothetical protein